MKIKHLLFALLLSLEIGNAQIGMTALPYLQFVPSPEGNGMGGITSSLTTNDPFALISSPARLGLQSLSENFGAGFFAPRTSWLPVLGNSGITYTANAAFAGIRIDPFLDLPFGLSVGLGYSYTKFDLGDFIVAYVDPTAIAKGRTEDHANAYTIGIGVDFGIKLGIGVTVRDVRSTVFTFGIPAATSFVTASARTYDYGLLASVPVARFIPGANALIPEFEPVLDLNFSAGRDNVGGNVTYIDPRQADPIPRLAIAGIGLEAGLRTHRFGFAWNVVSLTIVRQGEALLVRRTPDGSPYYADGFGDLNFFRNVIGGKRSDIGGVRKGVQINIAEIFSYRSGTFDLYSFDQVNTSGYGIRLRGILNAVEALGVPFPDDGVIGYFLHRIDIGYDQSKYASAASGLDQTTFSGVTVGWICR